MTGPPPSASSMPCWSAARGIFRLTRGATGTAPPAARRIASSQSSRAALAADERDERADRPAAEDQHSVVALHRRAADVVSRDGERLDERGVVVAERVGYPEQARRVHRPVLLHAARQVHAEHLEGVAEV